MQNKTEGLSPNQMALFRFSLLQLLMIFLLIGIFGGFYSAVLDRPYKMTQDLGCLSPDESKVLTKGEGGMIFYDLKTGANFIVGGGDFWNSSFLFESHSADFVDDDQVVVIDSNAFVRQLAFYSIPQREYTSRSTPLVFEGTYYFGKHVIAETSKTIDGSSWISFYDKTDGSRLRKRLPMEDDFYCEHVSMNPQGNLIGTCSSTRRFVLWDLETEKPLGPTDANQDEWPDAAYSTFSNDGKLILVAARPRKLCLMSTATQKVLWKAELNCAKAYFSDDDRTLHIADEFGTTFKTLDVETGEEVRDIDLRQYAGDVSDWMVSRDGSKIYLVPSTSDQGVVEVNADTQSSRRIGSYHRLPFALLFCVLFVAWGVFWGVLARRQARKFESAALDETTHNPDAWFDDESKSTDIPTIASAQLKNTPAVTELYPPNVTSTMNAVWNMMGFGGVIAILWSVIPLFYFHEAMLGSFNISINQLRIAFSTFGLMVGLSAAARGFGRYEGWMRTTAAFQILNLVNCDVVNGVLGIIATYQMNNSNVRDCLDTKTELDPIVNRV